MNKYIFFHPATGYYSKKINTQSGSSKLGLCEPADLKALPLGEVQDPTERLVCMTKDGHMVYAIALKEPPKGGQFTKLQRLGDCTWETYHALTCLETKIALVRLSRVGDAPAVLASLYEVEKIFSRGKGRLWTTTDKKESDTSPIGGEKSLDESQ